MRPAWDIGFSVRAFAVTHREVDEFEIVFSRSKNQIEIAEWINFTEVSAIGGDHFVITLAEYLGPAQRVFDVLAQKPGERQAEEFVAKKIEEPHGLLLHRIDQANAVDELRLARSPGFIESRQIFG